MATKKKSDSVKETTTEAASTVVDPQKTNGSAVQEAPSGEYNMPDDYAADGFETVRQWVEENPVLAVAGAAGLGFIAGQLVSLLIPDPEPPSFGDRVERRAKQFRRDAVHFAGDAGDVLADKLRHAADALSDAAESASSHAEEGYERASGLADVVTDAAKAAVAGVVAKKADSWFKRK